VELDGKRVEEPGGCVEPGQEAHANSGFRGTAR